MGTPRTDHSDVLKKNLPDCEQECDGYKTNKICHYFAFLGHRPSKSGRESQEGS
jgi:hypothetical protein